MTLKAEGGGAGDTEGMGHTNSHTPTCFVSKMGPIKVASFVGGNKDEGGSDISKVLSKIWVEGAAELRRALSPPDPHMCVGARALR